MTKQDGAFLTIGELAAELGLPHHILRYWETRFPALRPLQRAGNRRYYRPEDAALARRIHRLLNIDGYTVRGAQQALAGREVVDRPAPAREADPAPPPVEAPPPNALSGLDRDALIARLSAVREGLAAALD